MPSKSILAGSHKKYPVSQIEEERDKHINRLLNSLTGSFPDEQFRVVIGTARFTSNNTAEVTKNEETELHEAKHIIIATGSSPFVPPISGLETLDTELIVSDDVVTKGSDLSDPPKRLLTVGGGPIGLELSTFFHDIGSEVRVIERGNTLLKAFDPEFGEERVRAAKESGSFPIETNANLKHVEKTKEGVKCIIESNGDAREEIYDKILIATGRKPNIDALDLDAAGIERDERGSITHNEMLQTSVPNIYIAGDVTGHHQILHFAAVMGKIAGHNTTGEKKRIMDYDKHMLAVSFDAFPSAMIGITEQEAHKRGMEVVTATREFRNIGLGILKRQEYGLWKLIAEKESGVIIGSEILGPESAGELIQVLVPLIANKNTFHDIANMTWYHPTYAEILHSLANDLCHDDDTYCPGME